MQAERKNTEKSVIFQERERRTVAFDVFLRYNNAVTPEKAFFGLDAVTAERGGKHGVAADGLGSAVRSVSFPSFAQAFGQKKARRAHSP